jgi:hypothetical protein
MLRRPRSGGLGHQLMRSLQHRADFRIRIASAADQRQCQSDEDIKLELVALATLRNPLQQAQAFAQLAIASRIADLATDSLPARCQYAIALSARSQGAVPG